jgi:hypothetical protein
MLKTGGPGYIKEENIGGRNYIPSNDAEFDKWFKFLCQYVAQKTSGAQPPWTHIPAAALTALNSAYAETIGPHTPVDTEAKNDAKKAAAKVVRPFVNQYLRFPPVTDEDRTAMGIPNRDPTRTPVEVPKTRPVFSVGVKAIRSLTIAFHDEGTESRAIPYGMDGAVIFWDVLDSPPSSPKKLGRSELATRSPHTLSFEEEERGKTVYIAMRWQNEKGQKGEFTAKQSAIIP